MYEKRILVFEPGDFVVFQGKFVGAVTAYNDPPKDIYLDPAQVYIAKIDEDYAPNEAAYLKDEEDYVYIVFDDTPQKFYIGAEKLTLAPKGVETTSHVAEYVKEAELRVLEQEIAKAAQTLNTLTSKKAEIEGKK